MSSSIHNFLHGSDTYYIVKSPSEYGLSNVEVHTIESANIKLLCWYAKASSNMPTIAYFQGRNRSLGHESIVERWKILTDMGYGFACFNPRNYGGSDKGNPVDALDDDTIFMNFLINEQGISNTSLYCMGNSRGTGHAAIMARKFDCVGLILQAPYTDPMEINFFTRALKNYSTYPINCIDPLADYSHPVLIMHGLRDMVVPFNHGVQLAEIASKVTSVRFVVYEKHGHMDMPKNQVMKDVHHFIQNPPLKNMIETLTHDLNANESTYPYSPFSFSLENRIKNISDKKLNSCLMKLEKKRFSLVQKSESNFKKRYFPIFYNQLSSEDNQFNDKLLRASIINIILLDLLPLIEKSIFSNEVQDWLICKRKLGKLLSDNNELIYKTRRKLSPGISTTGTLLNELMEALDEIYNVLETNTPGAPDIELEVNLIENKESEHVKLKMKSNFT